MLAWHFRIFRELMGYMYVMNEDVEMFNVIVSERNNS